MTTSLRTFVAIALVGMWAFTGCGGDEAQSGTESPEDTPPAFTHKMMKNSDENMFAALAYECFECTLEQQQAIETTEGWTKGPTQVVAHSGGELRSTPSFEGVPASYDFVPEIPGNEYALIAKNLDGVLIEAGENGIIVKAQVMRDTLLRYAAGTRVHELTDPDGEVFVLIAYGVDPEDLVIPDFNLEDALGDFSGPEGWEYSSRVLSQELLLDNPDIATVLAIRAETVSTWERR